MTYIQSSGTSVTYLQHRYEYENGRIKYTGKNTSNSAVDGDNTWVITKFTYDTENNTKRQILTGTWTGRASLAWTII